MSDPIKRSALAAESARKILPLLAKCEAAVRAGDTAAADASTKQLAEMLRKRFAHLLTPAKAGRGAQ